MANENLNKEVLNNIIRETVAVCVKEQLEKYQMEIGELKNEIFRLNDRLDKLEEVFLWAAHDMQLNL